MYKKDYNSLYQLQNRVLEKINGLSFPFYLTGGTALSRFYLNHRNSEDLDFFVNNDSNFQKYISVVNQLLQSNFNIDKNKVLITEEFARFIIEANETFMKIEFVNDVAYRASNANESNLGLIDCPLNILSNKLTALIGRDEPKDVFDIVHISLNYSFNWIDVFIHAKEKALINEIDVEQRLYSFPVDLLKQVDWIEVEIDVKLFKKNILQLSNDFILGKNNSLGENKIEIEKAKLLI
jgi:predicted nucleotidyltransferase component of viral defense system